MKLALFALAATLLVSTACTPLPNLPPVMMSGSQTDTAMMAMAHNPDMAQVVSVDRFQDGFATLFKRSAPGFDPDNVSKILPAPNAPIDMDKFFLVHSLGPRGEKVTYYALDVVSDLPAAGWVFVNSQGQPVPGQLPIINLLPGEKGYSDFFKLSEVVVKDDYVANSLVSYDDVMAAIAAGHVSVRMTNRVANWAVVPAGTKAEMSFQGQPVSGYRAWYKGQVAPYLRFDTNLTASADGKVPTSPIVVVFKNGMNPGMGFQTETSGQTHNVVATLPGEEGYSSLWLHSFQGKLEGFDSVYDFASATANRGADLPNILVNCPVVGMPSGAPKTFTVTLESLTDGPTPLSPGPYLIHSGGMPFFTSGQKDRGMGLEHIAEDANPTDLIAATPGAMLFNTPVGDTTPGPATPGKKFQFSFRAWPGDHLSFVTMFGQSNDAFYAPSDSGIALFNGDMPVMGDVTSQVTLWDAGTEMNQEPGKGADQAPRQAAPNTGATESQPVLPISERKDGFSYGQAIRVMIEAK
jgi:hypothetical protein